MKATTYPFDPNRPQSKAFAANTSEPRTITVQVRDTTPEPQTFDVQVTDKGKLVGPIPGRAQSSGKQGEVAFMLRLPDELHTVMRDWAAAEHRSLNKQIIHILESAAAQASQE